jgi:hypothetical protein
MPSAAGQIWPHLPQSPASEVERRETQASSLARAMYPGPKIKPTNPYRESLLRGLREVRMKMEQARLRGGR